METLHYVRRKADGLYKSGYGFTPDKDKAFVFHEGAAMGISPFLTEEYEIIPLTEEEEEDFVALSESDIDLPDED